MKTNLKSKVIEEDYIQILLTHLKDLEKNYLILISEVSNEKLYTLFKENLINILNMQRTTYEKMYEKGWYTPNLSTKTQIKNVKEKIDKKLKDL